jgi:cytoskeletal protein RodZ
MKSLTSLIGWLLLVAVLAVPSFLFYNWWTKNKQQSATEVSQDRSASNFFPSQEKSQPPQAVNSTAAPEALQAPAAAASRQDPPEQVQDAPAQPAAASGAEDPARTAVIVRSSSAPAAVSVSTQPKPVSYYAPKGDRDPTLSPEDYKHLKELELRREEEERERQRRERNRPKEATCDSKIHLQGIVGNAAIINGEMYYTGQTAAGSKILKIGPNYILGECRGRKFRKVMK